MNCNQLGIRYFCRKDLPIISQIEKSSFSSPWSVSSFIAASNTLGRHIIVALFNGELVGYAVFDQDRNIVEVIKLAVAVNVRRRGIATALMDFIRSKLYPTTQFVFCVRESLVEAQLFLRGYGMRVVDILPHYFVDEVCEDQVTLEDTYQFFATMADWND